MRDAEVEVQGKEAMTSPLDALDTAQRALTEAREALAQFKAARDRLDDRAEEIDRLRAAKEAQLADLSVDVELGSVSPETLTEHQAELDRLTAEVVNVLRARDACDRRVQDAKRTETSAERALQAATGIVARPVYDDLRRQIREKTRELARLQRLWLDVAKTGGNATPWDGHCFAAHGGVDDNLEAIARSEGINLANMRPTRPLAGLPLTELRKLYTSTAETLKEPPADAA